MQLQLDCTKFCFNSEVVRERNKFPPLMVQCNMINSLKTNLTTISNMVSDKGHMTQRTVGFTTHAFDYF